MDQWIKNNFYLAVLIAAVLFTILMLLWGGSLYGPSYTQNFSTIWLATFLGVVMGVPLALWVNGYQSMLSEKEHKRKILQVLQNELSANQEALYRWLNDKRGLQTLTYLPVMLSSESWTSFINSGELQWIKDPNLLGWLSSAYHSVKSVAYLSEKYLDLFSRSREEKLTSFPEGFALQLDHYMADALIEIKSALDRINLELHSLDR